LRKVSILRAGNKSWIHRARTLSSYSWDEDDKQKVIDILRENFGIHFVRDHVIVIDGKPRYPDLVSTDWSPEIFVELDGAYHGSGDMVSESNGTTKRNEFYRQNLLQLIVINKEATDSYDEFEVVKIFEEHGFTRI